MATTSIEWTDATWNPVTGCTKVSPGCKHCYAERIAKRLWGDRKFTDVRTHVERVDTPLGWKKPRMVFVNSMSDLFHESVSDEFIVDVFATMAAHPGLCRKKHQHDYWSGACEAADWNHNYQILTKRPERMADLVPRIPELASELYQGDSAIGFKCETGEWPLPNVWLGTSVEDQRRADERIPHLLRTPTAVRFLSCEPLLGPVDLFCADGAFGPPGCSRSNVLAREPGIHWVIVGGESGANARPMHPEWARALRDQCQAAGVPFFFKQWGEWIGAGQVVEGHGPDGRYHRWPDGVVSSRIGKHRAGRLLDGREWNEFPEVASVATA